MAEQIMIPSIGTNGTSGVLKGRTIPGSLLRNIQIPAHTSTNANRVPIEVRSPATLPGTNAANKPTKTNRIILLLYGVLNLGCKAEKAFGKRGILQPPGAWRFVFSAVNLNQNS